MANEKEIKELVIKRLESMSENIRVSLGSYGEFDKEDLIKNVKEESKIGKLIIEIQLKYLKSLKNV